ncbi:MAG TPA: transposase [Acidimicrobiales bacterium]|nr:transposase [Acidimicrobiales bacterium]
MAKARADEQQPETKALLRARCKVKRRIAHLHGAGTRKARFRGHRKTKLQLNIAAAVVNIKRLGFIGAWSHFGARRRRLSARFGDPIGTYPYRRRH